MRTKILLLWFISALCACSSESKELPENILSKEEMVAIITDAQILDAAQKALSVPSKERKAIRDTNFTIVFNKYNTNAQMFDSSLKVYTLHPKLMGEIMEEVAENINAQN